MRKSSDGYYKNRHSCFLLQYHLVLVTKYRHPVITEDVEQYLRDYIAVYFKEHDCPLLAMETMPDHVHILFEAAPQVNLAEFVNAFKSSTSRMVRKNYAKQLARYYWKPYFWSLSYFIGTVSEKTTVAVQQYIMSQKDRE